MTRLNAKLADRLLPGARKLEESSAAAKRAFDDFAMEIDRIHARARGTVDDVESSLASIRTQAGAIDEIAQVIGAEAPGDWATVPPGEMPTPRLGANAQSLSAVEQEGIRSTLHAQHSTQWLNAVVVWKQALDDIERARAQWKTLVDDRRSAEKRLLRSLRDTDLGVLIAASATGGWSSNENVAFGIAGEMRGVEIRDDGTPNPAVDALLEEGLSGAALGEAWRALGLSREEVEALPMRTLAQLATCDGLSAWVQDIASRELLHYALIAPDQARGLLGLSETDMTVAEVQTQVMGLYKAWQDAKKDARTMDGAPVIQLLAVGSHDGALTAAISHGDLDAASQVAVNVSGMNSSVGDIAYDAKGARALYREAHTVNPSETYAAVTWIGYHSPGVADVNRMTRAEAGAPELAGFIDGVFESRTANGVPVPAVSVFAHSYGSTTAAVGLTQTVHPIDSFVMYGSAGLASDTSIEAINAESVYAAFAAGDDMAQFGRLGAHPRDPGELEGVQNITIDGVEGYLDVTVHDMFRDGTGPNEPEQSGEVGYLSKGTYFAAAAGVIFAKGGR
ncbi:alpha/beta hydrolase [Leucobacter chromiiresistens]|uniref:alpha/beta hydrolase n=1 Tax=Leucobacter chromiiresistens TaxID=1079994 RepID=UPI0015A2914C|nr:alpha/beta hydrolase [Leucobacter chromiiresistens]